MPAPSPLSVPSCPREQLKSLPRAELEGRLESTLIIIEALSLQLRGWNENQRSLPGVGPAEQRDALTQTDVTHPKGVRVLTGAMPPCSLQHRCCRWDRGSTAQWSGSKVHGIMRPALLQPRCLAWLNPLSLLDLIPLCREASLAHAGGRMGGSRLSSGAGLVQSPLCSAMMPLGGGDLLQPLPRAAEEDGCSATAAGSRAGPALGAEDGCRGHGVCRMRAVP